jgi:hypothetical protein
MTTTEATSISRSKRQCAQRIGQFLNRSCGFGMVVLIAGIAGIAGGQSGPPLPGASTLSVAGGPLVFSLQIGSSNPSAQSLYASVSSGTANFTATSNTAWLLVSPGSGVLGTSSTVLTVTINPAGLSAGTS